MTCRYRALARRVLISFTLAAAGCQAPSRPAEGPQARGSETHPTGAGRVGRGPADALLAADVATHELADSVAAIDHAREVVARNISNADTVAFKRTRALCEEDNKLICQLDLTQGSLESTSRPLDVAIQGAGFFKLKVASSLGNGIAYTRNGNFFVNKDGELILGLGDGYKLIPPITVPSNATDVTISQDGNVSVLVTGQTAKQAIGAIKLTQFVNPEGLRLEGGALYTETEASGAPVDNVPGTGGTGQLLQGFLENSNVDLTRESLRLRFLDRWRAAVLRAAGESE